MFSTEKRPAHLFNEEGLSILLSAHCGTLRVVESSTVLDDHRVRCSFDDGTVTVVNVTDLYESVAADAPEAIADALSEGGRS